MSIINIKHELRCCLLFASFGLLLFGCDRHLDKKDYIITERNLVPEGTAFDSRTGIIYVGSTFKRKIIQITEDGKVSDFIPEMFEGVTSIVGMEVDEERGIIWANTAHANEVMPLVDPDSTRDWMTGICAFDIQHKKLIKRYDLKGKAFLNDLTIISNGDVFATESVNNKIYRIHSPADSLELYLEPTGFSFLNGITYSTKFNALYVSSSEGILKIDLSSKNYILLKTPDAIDTKDVDGLTFYKNKLIGHQSSRVSIFQLNEDGDEVVNAEILDSGDEFDSSTTGEIGNDYYYFIVNSQIQSAIDKTNKSIKPVDSLKDIIIRRIKL